MIERLTEKQRTILLNLKENAKNHIYISLIDHLIESNISWESFIDKLPSKLKSLENKVPKTKVYPLLLSTVTNIYLACNIDCSKLLCEPAVEDAYFSEKKIKDKTNYFTHDYWNKIKDILPPRPAVEDIILQYNDRAGNDKLLQTYDRLIEKVKTAKEKIVVNELLLKGNNNKPGRMHSYAQAHFKVLGAIQKTIDNNYKNGNTNFYYQRILHLSPSQSVHKKGADEDLMRLMALEISEQSVNHISWCLSNYPNNCHIVVAPFTTFRSHMIIDRTFMITEDYIKSEEFIVPNIVHIRNLSYPTRLVKLREAIQTNNECVVEEAISKEEFEKAFSNARSYLENKRDGVKHGVHVIDTIFKKYSSLVSGLTPIYHQIKNDAEQKRKMLATLKDLRRMLDGYHNIPHDIDQILTREKNVLRTLDRQLKTLDKKESVLIPNYIESI